MPRRNYTDGERKREAIRRRDAERELRQLESELHAAWREICDEEGYARADEDSCVDDE